MKSLSCPTLCNPMGCSPEGSSVHGDSLDKNTGVGCHVLLQGIFLTQGSNQGLPPTLQVDSLLSKPPGKPKYIKIFLNKIKLTCNKDDAVLSSVRAWVVTNTVGDPVAKGLIISNLASLLTQTVKNPPAMWETRIWSLGWEDPLEEGMATHSSILAWRIPMDRGAWWAIVHGVTKSRIWLSD